MQPGTFFTFSVSLKRADNSAQQNESSISIFCLFVALKSVGFNISTKNTSSPEPITAIRFFFNLLLECGQTLQYQKNLKFSLNVLVRNTIL